MKRVFVVLIFSLFIVMGFLIGYNRMNLSSNAVITVYKAGTLNEIKTVELNHDEVREMLGYIREIKLLDNTNMVNLALLNEVQIEYDDNISIGIQLSEKNYCYYTDKRKNQSGLARMPIELYRFVEKKVR